MTVYKKERIKVIIKSISIRDIVGLLERQQHLLREYYESYKTNFERIEVQLNRSLDSIEFWGWRLEDDQEFAERVLKEERIHRRG